MGGHGGYPSDLDSNGQGTDSDKNKNADTGVGSGQDQATKITFSAAGLGGTRTNWEAVLWQDRLYVSVSSNQLAEGSKRAFVSLLEYAEEELEVTHVVACLDRLHHDNKNVIRNFLFLVFSPLLRGMSSFLTTQTLFASSTPSEDQILPWKQKTFVLKIGFLTKTNKQIIKQTKHNQSFL